MKPRRVLVALALVSVLAACATTPPGSSPGAAITPSPGAVTPATTPDAATPTPVPTPAEGPRWTVETLSRDDPTRPVHLQWPVVPGATALTRLLADDLTAREAAFAVEAEPNPEAPPELRGTWETVLDSPAWVGVRLDVYEFAGASGAETTAVFYGERTAGQAFRAAELIAPAARQAAVRAIAGALREAGHAVLEELVANPDNVARVLDDLTFGPRGELVARVGEGVLLPFSDGVVEATVAPSEVSGLLSEQGHVVREAVTGLDRPAAPTRTPEPPVEAVAPASVDCAAVACVALTFDDGPGRFTGRLLDTLAAEKVPATFFVLGSAVRVHPDLVRRMAAEGHEVGNHTFDHLQLTKLSTDAQRSQVDRGVAAIADAGVRATLFRPPYGSYNRGTRDVAGAPIILWDVDTLDWKHRSAAESTAITLRDTKRGSIVLMHDIHEPTVDAVPGIVAGLREKGFAFVTVSQLLGEVTPGSVHSRA